MDAPNLTDPRAALEVANAIDVVTADILKNTPRLYPKGHPVDDLPSVATDIEREVKRGRLEEARHRAEIVEKYLGLYTPVEEGAVAAKGVLSRRIHDILHPE